MRVLVCGGRDYTEEALVWRFLDAFHKRYDIDCVIHGAATGADSFAGTWAAINNWVDEESYPIVAGEDGFARNGRMLELSRPDFVVRFPGGNGTADMVLKASRAEVMVLAGLSLNFNANPQRLLI